GGGADARARVRLLVKAVAVRAGPPADDRIDDLAPGPGADRNIGHVDRVGSATGGRAAARLENRRPRAGGGVGRMPVEALACRSERPTVREDDLPDKSVLEFGPTDTGKVRPAVARVQ